MGAAEGIACEEVRASTPWRPLRPQLPERVAQGRETLDQRWHAPPSTLTAVTAPVWDWRQPLPGGITETIVAPVHPVHPTAPRRPVRGVRVC